MLGGWFPQGPRTNQEGDSMWTVLFLATALAETPPDLVLAALDAELARSMSAYGEARPAAPPGELPPYYMGLRATDRSGVEIKARYGAVARVDHHHDRRLDVDARVGSHELDSTHQVRDASWLDFSLHFSRPLPIEDDTLALRTGIWSATHPAVSAARERYARVLANRVVKVAEESDAGDFTHEEPVVDLQPALDFPVDESIWSDRLARLSERLDAHPLVESSSATLSTSETTEYIVTSEGTRIRQPRVWGRVSLTARTTADDGMRLRLYRWQDVHDPNAWPSEEVLMAWSDALRDDLLALRQADKGEPYTGPVFLKGAAAGVFIHEVLGHRSEGHRQKDSDEGHTFRDKVGETLLPTSISIVDDPTVEAYAGQHLNGHYSYDQEGVPAQPAVLVQDGVYQGFLMGRSPLPGVDRSNGHGRAQVGELPVARMANTIVSTTDPQSEAELRRQLLAEARAQGRDHGLLVDEIGGGFTLTGRVYPNAFNVRATYATKIYVDGRPDELVRGVDLVGTPLVALTNIMAAGNDPGVFNGFCGAESGMVPNSAVSPSLLIRQLEVQKKEKGQDPPPLLSKPGAPGGAA